MQEPGERGLCDKNQSPKPVRSQDDVNRDRLTLTQGQEVKSWKKRLWGFDSV